MKKAARRWTEQEDEVLRKAVAQYKEGESIVWHEVASNFNDRNNKDCRKRWVYTLAPSIKKGAWDDAEDALLLQGIKEHGYKWALVSQVVGSRQPDQCSRRWHETLNPNITHGRWSLHEDQKLREAVQIYGRRWTEIVERFFPDRTPIAAKNRYTQRFASASCSNSSPSGRASTMTPSSRAQSVSSSLGDDEDVYMQTVPELLWRDHSQGQMAAPVPMTMGNASHYRSPSQLSQIQTSSFATPPIPGTTIDGFLPGSGAASSSYSGSNPSVYQSSPSSGVDMFSPHGLQNLSQAPTSIDTPMEMSPEDYFPHVVDQSMSGHHSRHASITSHPNDGMMFKSEMDNNMLDLPQYMPDAHITPKASTFHNNATYNNMNGQHMMQHQISPPVVMAGGPQGQYYSQGSMMH